MRRLGINKMGKKEWWATMNCMGKGQKMGNASSNCVKATIWSSQQLCFHTRISTNTHGYHQTPTPRTTLIMWLSVLDTRAFRGADVNSDHHLVIAKIKLRLCRVEKKAKRLKKYNTAKLKVPEVAQKFKIELRNRFSCLADEEANNSDDQAQVQDLENDWKKIKETYQKTAEKVLGFRSRPNKPWISADSWKEIDNRKQLKRKMDSTRSERVTGSLERIFS